MEKFFFSDSFGLDISDFSLKLIKIKRVKKKELILSFGSLEIEEGVIENGVVKDEEKLAKFIRKGIEKVKGKKIKTKYVVTSLPEEKCFVQIISLPPMKKEDINSALVFELPNYIPIPVEKIYFDWTLLPTPEIYPKCKILVVGYPKEIVDSYFRALKLAKLEPVAFELESLAISRAILGEKERKSSVLILDLGETRTTFAIFEEGNLNFTLSIPISGNLLTELIARNFGIPFYEAEKIKIQVGIGNNFQNRLSEEKKLLNGKQEGVFEAVIPALVDLSQQLKKAIDFFETSQINTGKKIEKILLCGGGANLKGLRDFLAFQTKRQVEYANPFTNLSLLKPPPFSFSEALGLTTAIGLAMYYL